VGEHAFKEAGLNYFQRYIAEEYVDHYRDGEISRRAMLRRVPYQLVEEPNTRHAFFNDTGSSYNPDAANDAWPKTLAFFRQNLPA